MEEGEGLGRYEATAPYPERPRAQLMQPFLNNRVLGRSPTRTKNNPPHPAKHHPFRIINQQFCITSHPLKKVIITESTREVLFLQIDWCQQLRMATTAPLPLPQRRSRRLRGQKPLSPSRRQVEEEWSGASPTPPSGGGGGGGGGVAPFRGSALTNTHDCWMIITTR